MGNLIEFANQVKRQLEIANRPPCWPPEEAEKYMTVSAARRQQFVEMATRLKTGIIQPHLEALAAFFGNAYLGKDEPPSNASCWFGCCERFPVTAKVNFELQHDIRFEKLIVAYEAWVMPVFVKLNERDKISTPLESVNEADIERWVEDRLLDFLDVYLRIDRGGEELEEEAVTDPVCGMRINRSSAVSSESYRGYRYFFCSQDCQDKFSENPTEYVEVKAM